jgi:hypothetical protein
VLSILVIDTLFNGYILKLDIEWKAYKRFVMSDFTFRIRFDVSSQSNINIDDQQLALHSFGDRNQVSLFSGENDKPINNAQWLVLKGTGYNSAEDAEKAGLYYQDILRITLARLRIGTNFGNRQGRSGFFSSFLEDIQRTSGERILNNHHGLMVFSSEPPPKFASLGMTARLGCTKERFETIFKFVEQNPPEFNDSERIALELFNASFFVKSPDTRFITLVMAIECLIEPNFRNEAAQEHVRNLIEITKNNTKLDSADQKSYLSALEWFLKESIGQAGRRLVEERLGTREYKGLPAPKFFSKVYGMRSNLVHGNMPYPEWDEVGNLAATLEVFVADLISYTTLVIP